jgi:hypothetical protein
MASLAFLLICSGALSRPFSALFVRTARYNQETALLALFFLISFHSTNSPRENSFRPLSTALSSSFVGLTSGTDISLISSRSRLISLTSLCNCVISLLKSLRCLPKIICQKRRISIACLVNPRSQAKSTCGTRLPNYTSPLI